MFVPPYTLQSKADKNPSMSYFVTQREISSSRHQSTIQDLKSSTFRLPFSSAPALSVRLFWNASLLANLLFRILFSFTSFFSIISTQFWGTCFELTTVQSSVNTFLTSLTPGMLYAPLEILACDLGRIPSFVSLSQLKVNRSKAISLQRIFPVYSS